MRFIPVEEVPKRTLTYKLCKNQQYLVDFMNTGVKIAEVEWKGEWKTSFSAHSTLDKCAKRLHLPLTFINRGDRLFIVKETEK